MHIRAIALALVVAPAAAQVGESAERTWAYRRGASCLATGRYSEAVEFLDAAIKESAQDKRAYRCRAFANLLAGSPERATDDFASAIRLDPRDGVLYYGRASAYRVLAKHDEALRDLNRAIQLNPRYEAAYVARGLLRAERGDGQGALADALVGVAIMEERHTGWDAGTTTWAPEEHTDLEAGRAVDLGRFVAYECWSFLYGERRKRTVRPHDDAKGTAETEDHATALRASALEHALRRELRKAHSELDRAIKLAPEHPAAYKLRGVIDILLGELNSALADFTFAIERAPKDEDVYAFRSTVYKYLGQREAARRDRAEAERLQDQRWQREHRSQRDRGRGNVRSNERSSDPRGSKVEFPPVNSGGFRIPGTRTGISPRSRALRGDARTDALRPANEFALTGGRRTIEMR